MADEIEKKNVPELDRQTKQLGIEDEKPDSKQGIDMVLGGFASYNAHQDEFGQQEPDYRPSSEAGLTQQLGMKEQPDVDDGIGIVPRGFASYNAHQDEFGQQEPDYPTS